MNHAYVGWEMKTWIGYEINTFIMQRNFVLAKMSYKNLNRLGALAFFRISLVTYLVKH